jgi:hypothetical protein
MIYMERGHQHIASQGIILNESPFSKTKKSEPGHDRPSSENVSARV